MGGDTGRGVEMWLRGLKDDSGSDFIWDKYASGHSIQTSLHALSVANVVSAAIKCQPCNHLVRPYKVHQDKSHIRLTQSSALEMGHIFASLFKNMTHTTSL